MGEEPNNRSVPSSFPRIFEPRALQKGFPKRRQSSEACLGLGRPQKLSPPEELLDELLLGAHSRIEQLENLFYGHRSSLGRVRASTLGATGSL